MKQSEWEGEKKRLNENYQHIRERFGHVNVQPLHITTVIRHNKVTLVFRVRNLVRGFRQPQKIMMQTKKLQNYNLTNFLFNATTYILDLSHQQQWFLSYCSFFNEKSEHATKKNMHTQKNSQANAWKHRLYMTWDFTEMSV